MNTNGAENGCLTNGKTVAEVLCKSHYDNDHLQMGKNTLTVAQYSGLFRI
jgi:hypothetical protein